MSTVGATEEAAPFSFVLVLQGQVRGVGARSGWGGGGLLQGVRNALA